MPGKLTLALDDKAIQSALKKMERVDRNAVVSKGLRKGVAPIYTDERRLVSQHVVTGNLLRSMKKSLQATRQRIYVGFSRGKGKGNHSHLLLGTADRWTKTGRYTGSVRAKQPHHGWNIVEPWATRGQEAIEKLLSEIRKWLTSNWK